MDIIRWEDPPRDERDDARDLINQLLLFPNTWALVGEDMHFHDADDMRHLLGSVSDVKIETKIGGETHKPRSLYAKAVPKPRSRMGHNGDH